MGRQLVLWLFQIGRGARQLYHLHRSRTDRNAGTGGIGEKGVHLSQCLRPRPSQNNLNPFCRGWSPISVEIVTVAWACFLVFTTITTWRFLFRKMWLGWLFVICYILIYSSFRKSTFINRWKRSNSHSKILGRLTDTWSVLWSPISIIPAISPFTPSRRLQYVHLPEYPRLKRLNLIIPKILVSNNSSFRKCTFFEVPCLLCTLHLR
jgi:hypothetical protein